MKYQMKRGVSQSLYKYLPESWIDFSVRGEERYNYIAHVTRWNSEKLDDINKRRLIRVVNQAIEAFGIAAGEGVTIPNTAGYGNGLTLENCVVLKPKHDSDERGIVAELFIALHVIKFISLRIVRLIRSTKNVVHAMQN